MTSNEHNNAENKHSSAIDRVIEWASHQVGGLRDGHSVPGGEIEPPAVRHEVEEMEAAIAQAKRDAHAAEQRIQEMKRDAEHCNLQYSRMADAVGLPTYSAVENIIEAAKALRQRAERAEARANELDRMVRAVRDRAYDDGDDVGENWYRRADELCPREALAAPPEGESKDIADMSAHELTVAMTARAEQQPEDALAGLDEVALPCDVGVPINGTILKGCKLRTLLIALERRGMSTAPRDALRLGSSAQSPCPHVRTSDGGTSYCTLAEEGSAVPEDNND